MLNLEQITPGNKEQQFFFRHRVGVPKDTTFLDNVFLVPSKVKPLEYYILHLEFQLLADIKFTYRMSDYKQSLNWRDDNLYSSVAIIVTAARSYRNNHLIGRENNGTTNKFLDHVISRKTESTYNKPKCIVSQALYAIWLHVNYKKFTQEVLCRKYIKIMQNISIIGSEGEGYLSELLFVSKFAEITYSLTSKKSVTTYIEELKQEGFEKGRLEEKAAATRHMEQLVTLALSPKNGKRKTIREVAEIFQLSISRVKAIRAKMV